MVFVVGLPIFFAELVYGQYSGLGAVKVFTYIAPFFKGRQAAQVLVIFVIDRNLSRQIPPEMLMKLPWRFCFKGLGYCALMTTAFVSIYYMVIIAWVIYYLYQSFFPALLWGTCDGIWNTIGRFIYTFCCSVFIFKFNFQLATAWSKIWIVMKAIPGQAWTEFFTIELAAPSMRFAVWPI